MLVLSRKADEKIILGHGLITIQVIEIRGDKVRLGIDAPKDMPVHREEVEKAIQREQSRKPPIPADAACDVRGLAAADYETKLVNRTLSSLEANHKVQPPEDDQTLLDKMEDERGNC